MAVDIPEMINTLNIVASAAQSFFYISLCGGFIGRFWVYPKSLFTALEFQRRWKKYITFSLLGFAIALMTILFAQGLSISALYDNPFKETMTALILQTHYGNIQVVRFFLLISLILLWLIRYRVSSYHKIVALDVCFFVMLILMAINLISTSHEGDQGDFSYILTNGVVHLLSASGWAGSIITYVICFIPIYHILALDMTSFTRLVKNLSNVCTVSLVMILGSGIINIVYVIHSIRHLYQTEMGQVLLIKLCMVLLLVLLGAINRFILIPRISKQNKDSNEAKTYLNYILRIDFYLVILILVVTGILVNCMPPMPDMESMPV